MIQNWLAQTNMLSEKNSRLRNWMVSQMENIGASGHSFLKSQLGACSCQCRTLTNAFGIFTERGLPKMIFF